MEDPVTLRQTMEKVIRSSTVNSSSSNTKELHYLLACLAPAACRSPQLFAEVARETLRVDFNLLKKTAEIGKSVVIRNRGRNLGKKKKSNKLTFLLFARYF